MTQNIEDLHVYLRSIRPDERTSLSVLSNFVHDRATVLDLGCGSGSLGQYLLETRECISDGLTWSEAEAQHARPHYRHVVVADLEACDLSTTFSPASYDYIVCADVLEHLRHPERVLSACRGLLKPGGRLLMSVPNAGYAGLVAELLQGEFRYRDEGLLDRTHLRFFTRSSLARFLGEQRWAIQTLDTIRREMPESEFKAQFDQLPPAVARYIAAVPDALTYQFVGAAIAIESEVQQDQRGSPPSEPTHALFTAQLYMAHGQGYVEDGKRSATGVMGREYQTVTFELPASEGTPLSSIRLDPADRPGFLHLHALRLLNAQGQIQWEWKSTQSAESLLGQTSSQQLVWQAPLPSSGPTLILLTGDDPWFELPVPPAQLNGATHLEVDLGWPMSADYLALSATILPLQDQVKQLSTALRNEQQQSQDLSNTLAESLAAKEAETAQSQAIKRQAAGHERNAVRLQYELAKLQKDHSALVIQFKSLENSILYRATRPMASAKRSLKQMLGHTPPQPAGAFATADRPISVPIMPTQQPVDIIVPVYRGLADTRLCIESVLASPVSSGYRLIVINDCSPEPEVTEWLRERAAQDQRITLLENEENLGFVGTVNRGMALSRVNDVLLLNSDTEVANNWLDRIRTAAYSDQRIASVTPLSTNATICSYPRFCEDNPLPPDYDTARLDALCARTHPGVVLDVPTGVGFCMYIRRDSLEQVGLFDTENFGKGYGEENDFCQRAARAGWRNLHLLDTFVLHTGGVSFGESKSPRERAAMQTLARLHPHYARDVHRFVQADPGLPYRLALDVARITEAGVPVVLAVLHDRAGGTVRHVRELSEHLAGKLFFLTLTPLQKHSVQLRMAREGEGFELTFRLADQFDDLLNVLRTLGVRHVHYHHLLGHGQKIRDLPHLLDVSYDVTAHDYYSYCTHITLTGTDGHYAGEIAPGQCQCCPPDMEAPMGGDVAQWRSANARFLTSARYVLTPSADTATRISGFAPAARVHAIPHTDITDTSALPVPAPSALPPGAPLRIAVIGALSTIKGADILEAAALEAARRNAPVEFHLLGYGYRPLQTQPRAHLTVHGAYKETDLPGLLEWLKPDLVWFPAQWPETYSYTLSAALVAGLPVAVPDLGAFAERITGRPWSWVCNWGADGKSWIDTFSTLYSRHFATGTAPSLQESQPRVAPHRPSDAWSYHREYLAGIPAAAPLEPTSLEASSLSAYLTPRTAITRKSGLLSTLVYLRSLPVLRQIARRIPERWQRQVGSWLRG